MRKSARLRRSTTHCASPISEAGKVEEPARTLPAYFEQRLPPALTTLLAAAVAAGDIHADVEPNDLLSGVVSLCIRAGDDGHARRMAALLIDGLRHGAHKGVQAT